MEGTASGVKRKDQLWEEERWRGAEANRKVLISVQFFVVPLLSCLKIGKKKRGKPGLSISSVNSPRPVRQNTSLSLCLNNQIMPNLVSVTLDIINPASLPMMPNIPKIRTSWPQKISKNLFA